MGLAFIRNSRRWFETWDDFCIEPEQFLESGDRVLVFARLHGRAHASGIPLDESIAHVWSLRGTLVSALHVYVDQDKALEAVRLSE